MKFFGGSKAYSAYNQRVYIYIYIYIYLVSKNIYDNNDYLSAEEKPSLIGVKGDMKKSKHYSTLC